MRSSDDLRRTLGRIDGRGYKAYRDIQGEYDFGEFSLHIDHVQGDPFAAPSRIRVRVSQRRAEFPGDTYRRGSRNVGLCDVLTRAFDRRLQGRSGDRRGSGKSGMIEIECPGQEILERTSVNVNAEFVEARFSVGLPARGRRVMGKAAEVIFFDEIPEIVRASLLFRSLDREWVYRYIEIAEDQDLLRNALSDRNLVAFVPEEAILPRQSGVDDHPLSGDRVIRFTSPPSMRVTFELPNRGSVSGMGIPEGVTLIVGGGYHGKSTLLDAIELGVYNHIPGDGREYAVTDPAAVKIRAEDGRGIEKVDISPFISNLPYGVDTVRFSTENASGSTSQAANIVEALEAGARLLLIDEDTSATNFMIRDHRMQELVAKEKEPITPFIDKVRLLYADEGVSTILVVGGSGEYFDVADTVVLMDEYRARDVTDEAQAIAQKHRAERSPEGGNAFGRIRHRVPVARSFDARRGRRDIKISIRSRSTILFGRHTIDLSAIEQVVSVGQTNAIADAIIYARDRYMGRSDVSLREIVDAVARDIDQDGLDVLNPRRYIGSYARPRTFEIAAAINRLREMRMEQRLEAGG